MSNPQQEMQRPRQPQGLASDAKELPQGDPTVVVKPSEQVTSAEAAAPSGAELKPSELDHVTGGKAVAMGPDLWE